LRRLVIASADAKLPTAWSDAETIRGRQITAYTPPGTVRRAVDWTQRIHEMQVTDRPLLDILSLHGTSLWWFIRTLVYSSTKQAVLTIERCENLLYEKSPEQVLLAGMGAQARLIAQLCDREKIDCITPRSPFLKTVWITASWILGFLRSSRTYSTAYRVFTCTRSLGA
jgi:hypothetical protein